MRTWEGWAYLASVMDLASRRIVGWAIADRMEASLVVDAMAMALADRRPPTVCCFIPTAPRRSDASGRRNTLMMEPACDGGHQAAEGDVADAGEDLFAGRPPVWQREQVQRFWVKIAEGA